MEIYRGSAHCLEFDMEKAMDLSSDRLRGYDDCEGSRYVFQP